MNFNKHSGFEGKHAFLSPSKYYWVNYDDEKLDSAYVNHLTVQRGTELHDLAKRLIELGVMLPEDHTTLSLYVNDAIGYGMTPEQTLYYSPNCFGHADAISFDDNLLRIHDLKTGAQQASVMQLEIYAALFCLEYNFEPNNIGMELRLYQSDDVAVHRPEPKEIRSVMNKIVTFDERINKLWQEG